VHGTEPGHTFTPDNALRFGWLATTAGAAVDYIMARCGDHGATLDVTRCELALNRPVEGVCASDHFGVMADLEPAPSTANPP
jgi:hypothetical protein